MPEQALQVKLFERGAVWSCTAEAALALRAGAEVVVQDGGELEEGRVWALMGPAEAFPVREGWRRVLRLANDEDRQRCRIRMQKEEIAFAMCRERAQALNVSVRIVGARYSFDESRAMFYFYASGGVDVAALEADMSERLGARAEMWQMDPADDHALRISPSQSLTMGGAALPCRLLPSPPGIAAPWLAFGPEK